MDFFSGVVNNDKRFVGTFHPPSSILNYQSSSCALNIYAIEAPRGERKAKPCRSIRTEHLSRAKSKRTTLRQRCVDSEKFSPLSGYVQSNVTVFMCIIVLGVPMCNVFIIVVMIRWSLVMSTRQQSSRPRPGHQLSVPRKDQDTRQPTLLLLFIWAVCAKNHFNNDAMDTISQLITTTTI